MFEKKEKTVIAQTALRSRLHIGKRIAVLFAATLLIGAAKEPQVPGTAAPGFAGAFSDGEGLIVEIERGAGDQYVIHIFALNLHFGAAPQADRVLLGRVRGRPSLELRAEFPADMRSAKIQMAGLTTTVQRISTQEAATLNAATTPATKARLLSRFGTNLGVGLMLDRIVRAELQHLYAAQVAYRAAHGSFTDGLRLLGFTASDFGVAAQAPSHPVRVDFAYEVTVNGDPQAAQQFTIRAVGATARTKGMAYSISSEGAKAGQVLPTTFSGPERIWSERKPQIDTPDIDSGPPEDHQQRGAIEQL